MHATTRPPSGDSPPTSVAARGLVDADALICPGCHHRIRPEPPTPEHSVGEHSDGEHGRMPGGWFCRDRFCHYDGSPLCGDRHGRACEPIEIRELVSEDTENGSAWCRALRGRQRL